MYFISFTCREQQRTQRRREGRVRAGTGDVLGAEAARVLAEENRDEMMHLLRYRVVENYASIDSFRH